MRTILALTLLANFSQAVKVSEHNDEHDNNVFSQEQCDALAFPNAIYGYVFDEQTCSCFIHYKFDF